MSQKLTLSSVSSHGPPAPSQITPHTLQHAHARTHTHTNPCTHTHKLRHAYTPMHTHTNPGTHTQTQACMQTHAHTHKLHAYFTTTDVRQWNYLWISFMTIEMSQITPTATSPHLSKYTHYFSHSCSHPNAYPTPPLFHNNSMGVPDVNPPPTPPMLWLGLCSNTLTPARTGLH